MSSKSSHMSFRHVVGRQTNAGDHMTFVVAELIIVNTMCTSKIWDTCVISKPVWFPEKLSWQHLTQIAKFTGPTWGPPGSCRPQMGPMLAPKTLLSGEPMQWWASYVFVWCRKGRHIEARTKRLTFGRELIQMHFIKRECLCCHPNRVEVRPSGIQLRIYQHCFKLCVD